jgi:succinoglycan biosynthesis protein ExoA
LSAPADEDASPRAGGLGHVLVVLPALNEAAAIGPCLQSLIDGLPAPVRSGAQPGPDFVVADGGSTDGTQDIVRGFDAGGLGLRLIDNPGRLQSAGINRAAAGAGPGHQLLIRCDVHALYPPGFIADLAAVMAAKRQEAPDLGSVVVAMDAEGQTGFARAAAWIVDTKLGSGGAAHRGGQQAGWVDHGHHAAFDLNWFNTIGGYDPAFSHNEDAEYDLRLAAAGGRIWLETGVRLRYFMRPGPGALARQYRNYGAGRARTLRKHARRPALRQMIPVVNFLGCLAGLALAPVWGWGLLWPGAYLLGLGAVSARGAQRMGPAGLWAGVALLLMHNAWAVGFVSRVIRRA